MVLTRIIFSNSKKNTTLNDLALKHTFFKKIQFKNCLETVTI